MDSVVIASIANGSAADGRECPQIIEHFKEVYPVEQWKKEGFFEDDDLLDIACHWMKFEPVRPSVHFLLFIVFNTIFVVGFSCNAFSIYIIVR